MGACASVSKAMRGDADAAVPPPEPRKEEVTTTDTTITTTEVAEEKVVAVEEEEKKIEGGDDKAKVEEDEKNKDGEEGDDKHQSLGALLNESEEAKVSPKTEKIVVTETAPTETVNSEEQKPEALVILEEKAAYVAPVALPTTEEKKEAEVKEDK